jgi:hypothetical protein
MLDAVRQKLGREQAELRQLCGIERTLEAVQSVASFASGLRTGLYPHVQAADDLVATKIDGCPFGGCLVALRLNAPKR